MKASTRKVIGIDVVMLALMLVLAVLPMPEILRSYLQAAVLAGALGASCLLLGWASPRRRKDKLINILVVLVTVAFQVVVFVLLGLKLGFVTNVYQLNLQSLWMVLLPTVLAIVGEEVLRGQLVEKSRSSVGAVIATGITIWLAQILIVLPLYNLSEARGWFDLAVVVVAPALLDNFLTTYIAYYYDYRINIVYRLIVELPVLIMPIWPETSQYLSALFVTVLVFVLLVTVVSAQKFGGVVRTKLETIRKPKRLETESVQKRRRVVRKVVVAVLVVVMLGYAGLMSGLFKWYFLAIGSGSMEPVLKRGDMVLVEKSDDYDEMEVGEILIYRHSNVVMVHRIAEKREDGGKWTFITKGDANNGNDSWVVGQGDVIGIAKGKIAAFGYPTLWLNELFNGGKI